MSSAETREAKGPARLRYALAVAVGVGALAALAPVSVNTARSLADLAQHAEINVGALTALDQLTTDIRRALRVKSFQTNAIVLEYAREPAIQYEYRPATGTLARRQGHHERVLLTGCKDFRFSMFQRTPIAGSYDQYPAATNTETKVIAVHWATARKRALDRPTHDQVYSAKVVIRCR